MKSAKFVVLFGALSIVFMGCPYESKVPVDDSSNAKGDKQLVGKWTEKGDDSYEWKVTLDDNTYHIEKKNIKDGGDPTIYGGFLSDISGSTFFNVWEKTDDGTDKKYYVYIVEKKGDSADRVKLRAMTDNVTEEFDNSADLRTFIKKYMDLSFFWNKDDEKTYYRN